MPNFFTVIPRLGNKTTGWKHIKEIILNKCKAKKYYCEPFLGSGFVLLKVKKEIPNLYCMVGDLDNELGNFWWQSLNYTEQMSIFLETAPSSESLFNWMKTMIPENDIQRAVRFWYLCKLSGPGTMKSPGRIMKRTTDATRPVQPAHMGGGLIKGNSYDSGKLTSLKPAHMGGFRKDGNEWQKPSTTATMDGFYDIMNLLKHRTSFLQEDYETLLNRADKLWGKDKFTLYLDPPYVGTEGYYGSDFDHDRLYEVLKDRDFMLSYNDCPEIRKKYKDFNMISYNVRKRQELFIYSNGPTASLEPEETIDACEV